MATQTCESCGMPMRTDEDHAPGHPGSTWCRYCSVEAWVRPSAAMHVP